VASLCGRCCESADSDQVVGLACAGRYVREHGALDQVTAHDKSDETVPAAPSLSQRLTTIWSGRTLPTSLPSGPAPVPDVSDEAATMASARTSTCESMKNETRGNVVPRPEVKRPARALVGWPLTNNQWTKYVVSSPWRRWWPRIVREPITETDRSSRGRQWVGRRRERRRLA